ncbi:hypothetical protein GCK72_008856 [Caenorhabditis remanei]|uniref:Uncharacterized protein n=1 Tax=Caenorhabditis remanei TaxID=31234 RepID=A0A6A5GZU6_CAERE|nr:hypothetical protein GCK72_008856 [Caenorhabditis remanei]KAF1760607.1 hypothetical protein GCK72_008856 [Caenorhabditis remanei]
MFCSPIHLTGLGGNGAPIGWKAQVSSFGGGFGIFVVERHELLPNTYTYFCRSCFQEFNFVHGVKTHSFNAWPYTELKKVECVQNGWPFEEQNEMED